MSWFSYILGHIPIVNGFVKLNNFKDIVNNVVKSIKIIKDKNIKLLDESIELYRDEYLKITGKATLGAKYIENKKKIVTIEYKDKKCIEDNGMFKKINQIYQKLNNIKKNPKKENYERDINIFNEKIGNSIINGKLHITVDLDKEEIKLIFEINDMINVVDIYGNFELVIKFLKPTLGYLLKYSELISKNNSSIDEEEDKLFYSFLGMIAIILFNEDEQNLSIFLSWIYAIGNKKDLNLKMYLSECYLLMNQN